MRKRVEDLAEVIYQVKNVYIIYNYPLKGRYTAISKKVVGENGEWRMSKGGCTTERNYGYAIWQAKFHKLRSSYVKMNTPIINVYLRVLGSEDRRNSRFFRLKDVPRFV